MKYMNKESTGERLEFHDFSDVTVEHLHRYAIANDFIEGKVVLDIASGEGYGSNILAKKALKVIGVDIDIESIKNANEKYIKNNLKYIVGSADNIPIESNSIDVVVSFETIEHHNKHDEMLLEIKRVLKKDGLLVMSSPDKKNYSDIPNFKNKFHVKELYFDEFEELVKKHFDFSDFYVQKAFNLNSIVADFADFSKMKVYSGSHLNVEQEENIHLYIISVASDNKIERLSTSLFNGYSINNFRTDQYLRINSNLIKSSSSYMLGNFITSPFFYLKKIFKHLGN
jgi:ubiquinone/menaquinone biosynthesis C-methylase UbiE